MTATLSPGTSTPPRSSTPRTPSRSERRRHWLSRVDVKASPYAYVAPFFILFGLVGLFPLVYTFVVSLFDWDLLKGQGDFVGLANFASILQDEYFWNSLFNTFSIFLLSAIPQLVAATFIAAILDQNIRSKTFWRMSVLLPYVVTPAAVALIFSNMFSEDYGLINNMLQNFNLDAIGWKTDTLPSHIAIATMVNWRWTGYNALILLAAMQSVPRDVHESAALDGAGALRRFFSITLPSIRPTMVFVIITATIGGLQIFVEPRMFDAATAGGSQRQFQTTVLYLWEMAFFRQNFGKASAIAWLLFLIIVGIGLINFMLSKSIATAETKVSRSRRHRRLARYRQGQATASAPSARGAQSASENHGTHSSDRTKEVPR
ncbi:carbohydrate ABC transporter permease [Microbacterium sp. MPKO10]|uniref:carbohydrate ABC transporter permease n=1 Tax=Microbacterium sp. MPKO10 TaxID=2989818 RepID=UPI002236875E|nr:sugar ABC transporter permease [Microbacterium sp. MPKO10]MCW4456806.1 sugar ABC transporter permease [Microbacterium sp. MPKO10]